MPFTGFPDEAVELYEGLAADNSRTFWDTHRATYDAAVRGPMVALLAELEEEFGPGHVFRPHRDVRFSKDKRPFKEHQGGYVEIGDGIGFYVQISAEGLLASAGWWRPQGQQIARFREAVAGPPGAELDRSLRTLQAAGLTLGGDRLKTRPRGIDPDHPRLELLRHRSLTVGRTWTPQPWLATTEAAARVRSTWREVAPVAHWLVDAVGPGEDAPPPEPR
jgi:uncharacterized protein (TIGR02453 family)